MTRLIELWSRPPPSQNAMTGESISEKAGMPQEDEPEKRHLLDVCESHDGGRRYPKRQRYAITETVKGTGKGTTETIKGTTRTIKGDGKSTKVSRVKAAKVEKPGKLFPNLDGACDEYWVLGPNMFANDTIRTYAGYRDHTT